MQITIKNPNQEDIKTIIMDEEIYDRISDDNSPSLKEFQLDTNLLDCFKLHILGGYIADKIVSLYIVHDGFLHFMVLKPYRKYARELYKLSAAQSPQDIYTKVASKYKSLINFAKHNGFIETGIEPLSLKTANYMTTIF